jgi:hypothetical protein
MSSAPVRFTSNDSAGTELPWQSVEAVLDALEDGRLAADDYVFDAARQAWQPIRKHDEIVAAWDRRMGYRPPEQRRLLGSTARPFGFPALDSEGVTPLASPAIVPLDIPVRPREEPESPTAQRWAAVVGIGIIVVLIGGLLLGFVMLGKGMQAASG